MNDIPFTELIAGLLEISLEDQGNEKSSDAQEDEKGNSAINITDNINESTFGDNEDQPSKNLEKIASMTFDSINFEKFKTFMEKCSKQIQSPSSSIVTWQYLKKYYSYNIPVLFYVLLECLEKDILLMLKICEIFRHIFQNFNHKDTIDNLKRAVFNYRISHQSICNAHILMFQLLSSNNVLSAEETIIIAQVYYGKQKILSEEEKRQIYSEKLKFPRNETVTDNFKNASLRSMHEKIQNKLNSSQIQSENDDSQSKNQINDIMEELISQAKVNKFHHNFSPKFLSICTVAYIYGSKSYNFLRQFFPLPHENTLRKWYLPEVNFFIECLTNKQNLHQIINEFIKRDQKNIYATLAVDAAKFKDVTGESILKVFPNIKNIKPDKIYNNIFIYYLQPMNCINKPFPVFVQIAENGSANDETVTIIKELIEIIEKSNIKIHFIATDGDHKFDSIHQNFFSIILDGFKSKGSFHELINHICNSNVMKIPVSDFFHLLKNIRSHLIKYGIEIDFYNKISILPENLDKFNMGKALSDLSQNGKMRDNYPLEIFSGKNLMKAIKDEDWDFFYYGIPFNLLINAIRNPDLSINIREYFLETVFYFFMKIFYEMKDLKSPTHSRIGIIRLINTVVAIAVALRKFDFVKLGYISSHLLENFFGHLRVCCNFDHSYKNIFSAIGKTLYIKQVLANYDLNDSIKTRAGYSGATACITKTGGIIPSFSPFVFFCKVYKKVKNPKCTEINDVIEWYLSFKSDEWDERISNLSDISGVNIVARYLSGHQHKKDSQIKPKNMEKFNYVRSLKRIYGLRPEDETAFKTKSMLEFLHFIYEPINSDLTIENHDLDTESYLAFHSKKFVNGLKNWNYDINNDSKKKKRKKEEIVSEM